MPDEPAVRGGRAPPGSMALSPADADLLAGRRGARAATRMLAPVFSLACLAAVVLWASRQSAPRLPAGADGPLLLAGAVAVYAGVVVLRAERWHSILAAAGVHSPRGRTYSLTAVGYMGNNVLPARGGELLKLWLLSREAHAGGRQVLGTVLAERVLDLAAVGLLFLVAAAGGLGRLSGSVAIPLLAAVAAGLGLALVVHLRSEQILVRSGRARRLAAAVGPALVAVGALRSRHGLALLGLSLVLWALEALVYLLSATAAGASLGWIACLYVMCFSNLAGTIPAGPGYVGTFDGAVLVALGVAGVAGGVAVTVLVALRFILFLPITVVGLGLLLLRHGGWRECRLARGAEPAAWSES